MADHPTDFPIDLSAERRADVLSRPLDAGVDPLWRHQLSLLLESTGEGIFGIDLDGHCMFINRAGAELLGHDPAALIGRNMHETTHHSHASGAAYAVGDCPIFNAFRRGLPCRIDSEVFWRSDGSAFAVEYSSHPIIDAGAVRGAVIAFVDITERKRVATALQRSRDELEERVAERTAALSDALRQVRELSAWTHSVREQERTRIAREIHDEFGSLLVALKMELDWIGKRLGEQEARAPQAAQRMREQLRGKCHDMGGLIERAVADLGRIITDLRPSILDHQGLWAALEWQAGEFARTAELQMNWHAQIDAAAKPSEPASIAVFRIFQEMLSNIGRHAQARCIDVRIVAAQGRLDLHVSDDGIGAVPGVFESPGSYGVRGMRERALHFGGSLAITSTPGQGSRVHLSIPIPS